MSSPAGRHDLEPAPRPVELTFTAILLGIVLSVVMGAANVYLGLRAGMTVSASIPAAVLSMGILQGLFRRKSILESNLVQTSASAGESLAAGIIFTMPALLLTGVWKEFDFWTTSLIALAGGLLGVLLMIPMRRVFVVDNEELRFPEGVACAEVLRAGTAAAHGDATASSSGLGLIIGGMAVGGGFKLLESLAGLFRSTAEVAIVRGQRVFYGGADISPALFSVGYIVTLPIATQIFAGGAIGWLIAIPLLGVPESLNAEPSAVAVAAEIWSTKVRYIGVGAMVVGGVASIWRVRAGLAAAFGQLVDVVLRTPDDTIDDPAQRNLSGAAILALAALCVLLIAWIYSALLGSLSLTLLTTLLMLVMSFFFAAVASYIVGLVGNSNSPVSGMTITAVLASGALIGLFGFGGTAGIVATLGVAGVVCCVACTSGDVCNDLKTGQLVGASPRSQQIMQVIGVTVAAFVMAPVMQILHEGSILEGNGGIGGRTLPAPQAGLFAALAEGFFSPDGELPKDMVGWGIAIGLALLVADKLLHAAGSRYRLHVMPVAVGIYLPLKLSVPILIGGLVRSGVDRAGGGRSPEFARRGVLIASGIIAGESLLGVADGVRAYLGISSFEAGNTITEEMGLSAATGESVLQSVSLAALLVVAAWVYRSSVRKQSP